MSHEKALVPIEERQVPFYDDELTATLVDLDGREQIYVPIRPICEYLRLAWAPQYSRIQRDPVLSEVVTSVTVTVTEAGQRGSRICLPLKFLLQGVFTELHQRFRVTGYKLIPQEKFAAILAFLNEWENRVRENK